MKTRTKKSTTSEAVAAAREILGDFLRTYSLDKHEELSLISMAALSDLGEGYAISRSRRLEAIKYLSGLSEAVLAAYLVAESDFLDCIFAMDPPDEERVQEIREKIAALSKPFWQEDANDETTERPLELVSGILIQQVEANKDKFLAKDAGRNFFLRYSLQESMTDSSLLDGMVVFFFVCAGLFALADGAGFSCCGCLAFNASN